MLVAGRGAVGAGGDGSGEGSADPPRDGGRGDGNGWSAIRWLRTLGFHRQECCEHRSMPSSSGGTRPRRCEPRPSVARSTWSSWGHVSTERLVGLRRHDVADYLARHLQVPLAVVPPDVSTSGVRRVVVGVSGAPGERDALRGWPGWPSPSGPRSWRFTPSTGSASGGCMQIRGANGPKNATCWRGSWCEPLRRAGVLGDVRIVEGMDPAEILAHCAQQLDADLVAVGVDQTGRRGVRRMMSVSGRMLHRHMGTALVQIPHSGTRSPGRRQAATPCSAQAATVGDTTQPC